MDVGLRLLLVLCALIVPAIAWCIRPFKALTWWYHDILGWHRPNGDCFFDGTNIYSHCRICGKEIMQDSQGNWF